MGLLDAPAATVKPSIWAPAGSSLELMERLNRGLPAALGVMADSTGDNETYEWVGLLGRKLAADYPAYNVRIRTYSSATAEFAAPTDLQVGPNGARYAQFNGAAYSYLVQTSTPGNTITGDLDVRAHAALTDWTPASDQTLLSKFGGAGNRGWKFTVIATTGKLQLVWSPDGTALITGTSSVPPTVADGAALHVRATLQVNNGSTGNTVTFYTSTDGATWTQLGTPVVTAGTTSIFASTWTMQIGGRTGSTDLLIGKVYSVAVLRGIAGPTVVPCVPELWQTDVAGAAVGVVTFGGSPTLNLINGSVPGANMAYLSDATRLPLMTPDYGQSLTFIGTQHNEGNKTREEIIPAWDAFYTAMVTRMPYTDFIGIAQNPRTAPALTITEHSVRAVQWLAWCKRKGIGSVNMFRAFSEDSHALSQLVRTDDGVHPTNDAGNNLGSVLWANTIYRALTLRV